MSTIVVGGGVAGMAAARILSAQRVPITLIESSSRLGGLVETEREDGVLMEWGPDSILGSKPGASRWLDDLGMTPEIVRGGEKGRGAYVAINRRLHPMPGGFLSPRTLADAAPVLRSSLLSTRGKLRLLFEPLPGRGKARDESVRDFA
ncbi:MAG: FAD-dependent oxidoreductase, partial [Myxococcales bacterium]|nr:FAD-dependent oxidoreductase [Myxococcales bacterium]